MTLQRTKKKKAAIKGKKTGLQLKKKETISGKRVAV